FASLGDALTAACEGLFYVSETDARVLPFCGNAAKDVTGEIILHQTDSNTNTPVEEISFEEFFGRLTTIREWYGEAEKARAEKFLELQKLLEENLRGLKVFRLGKIRLAIFAVGLDKDGRLMGITTGAVET
ncbi:MAG TPA: nuclease A inhibitor family protein, partial [Pyrinomonadaceae bacterium]|nr:nuclease A inhibitor family protein [Pyrinomonadaceae bacterium]